MGRPVIFRLQMRLRITKSMGYTKRKLLLRGHPGEITERYKFRSIFLRLSIPFLLISFNNLVQAQTANLRIYLKSESKDSLVNASIQVYSLTDTLLLNSQVSKPGVNMFSVRLHTKYLIRVSATGHESAERTVNVGTGTVSVTVEIKAKISSLNAVTVLGKRPLFKQEDDKMTVDAENLANSSTNGYEVLEKTPGLVIDQDGNVYITSSTPATITI